MLDSSEIEPGPSEEEQQASGSGRGHPRLGGALTGRQHDDKQNALDSHDTLLDRRFRALPAAWVSARLDRLGHLLTGLHRSIIR